MLDALGPLQQWLHDGGRCAVATVVRTWSSAPRPVGALMAVGPGGQVAGSISGGCVEGAVHEQAMRVIDEGSPILLSYGVSDEDAFAVGLTCGGTIEVLVGVVTPAERWVDELIAAIEAGEAVTLSTVVSGGHRGSRSVTRGAPLEAIAELRERGDGAMEFVQSLVAAPSLLVYGANDFAVALAEIGRALQLSVTVCDARAVFAPSTRFPGVSVVVDWPHRHFAALMAEGRVDSRTAVCALSHDDKFDVPLLALALRSPAGYVGALGSRRTTGHRLDALREQGLTADELAALRAPIGLDIGGRTPHEIAVAVVAEIISVRRGGTGKPLAQGSGRIHP